jgi:hypothetical protein
MKSKHAITFAAALSLALCAPAVLSAQSSSSPAGTNGAQTMSASQDQANTVPASQMVGTRAGLVTTIDAKDAHAGQQFEAKLPRKVHLKDGTELPGGTMLIGKIGTDDMNVQGKSKLVLCINEARLKDGKTVPVKATVVGIYPAGTQTSEYYMGSATGDQVPNPWHNGVTKIDELDALHNVDLHSNLKSSNSGVLVSNKDDNIKLKSGTELALAIAEEPANTQQSNNGPGGGR